MMTRMFGHYVSLEMFYLWLIEFSLSFLVIYLLLLSSLSADLAPGILAPGMLPSALLDHGVLTPHALADLGLGRVLAALHINLAAANHAVILALTIGIVSIALGLYRLELCFETQRLMINTAAAGVLASPLILAMGWLLGIDVVHMLGVSALWPFKILLAWVAMVLATRFVFGFAMRLNLFARPVLVVGSDAAVARTSKAIDSLKRSFFRVAGTVRVEAETADARPLVLPQELLTRRVWGIVVTPEARARFGDVALQQASRRGIRVFGDIEFREREQRRIDLETLDPSWLLSARGVGCSRLESAVRRAGDVLLSLAFLVACLPLMVLTAIAIRLDSPGPVFYRQERVGLYGRPFTLFKFRSMSVDAEARGPSWAATKDPRVTRVGSFIRLTRIDELPQLVNVLRGEMGFIGPRPERPHFVEQLAEAMPRYRDRSYVKPGITGWAQVNFRYGASIEDSRMKLSYDLYYVKHRSLFLDVLILFATVRVILFQEGAR